MLEGNEWSFISLAGGVNVLWVLFCRSLGFFFDSNVDLEVEVHNLRFEEILVCVLREKQKDTSLGLSYLDKLSSNLQANCSPFQPLCKIDDCMEHRTFSEYEWQQEEPSDAFFLSFHSGTCHPQIQEIWCSRILLSYWRQSDPEWFRAQVPRSLLLSWLQEKDRRRVGLHLR